MIRVRFASLAFLSVIACSPAVAPDGQPLRGSVNLIRADANASSGITGTFKSVADSVALSVTGGATPVTAGARFAANSSSIPFLVILPEGSATIAVQVISNNKQTQLFSGSTTANIDRDGFSITVPITALRPVLVVFPDTVRTDSTRGLFRYASVTVHNSGKDSLSWSVARTPTNTGNTPDPCASAIGTVSPCLVTPPSGKVAANADIKLVFRMPILYATGGLLPAGSFTYVFTSPEGSLTLLWRYPATPPG